MQKTRKEANLVLMTTNLERMKKGKDKKEEDESRFIYEALGKYHSMIDERE